MQESKAMIEALALNLQVNDPTDASEIERADIVAGAMLSMSLAYIRDRVGEGVAIAMVHEMLGKQVPSTASLPGPIVVGASVPTLHPAPRRDPSSTIQGQAQSVLDFLNQRPLVEADMGARPAIWGCASYLREHQGDDRAVECLKAVEQIMSVKAWFEQLPVPSVARN